jgi:type I restriction enzyme S subunit
MTRSKVRLGDAATFINGYAFKPSDWRSTGKEIIRIQNLTNTSDSINYFEGVLPEKYKVKKGDLLISWSATLGIYEWKKDEAWLNQHIFKVVFDKYEFDKRFFFHLISYNLNKLKKEVHGSTMKHITKERFDKIQIPLPPLETQKKIAAILDKADELRQNDKKILEKYDKLAQSVFLEMFGDPVINSRSLKIVRLEDIATRITDGVHAKPNYVEEGVPFISVKDITTGVLEFDNCKFISKEDHLKFTKRCKPEYDDILYTKVGATYGRPALVDKKIDFSIYVSVALIKPKRELVNSSFLKETLAHPAIKRQADKAIKGIGVPDLHLNMIKEFVLPLPALADQEKYAAILSEVEFQKKITQEGIRKSEDLFQSLLQRAFRGELM